MAFRKQLAKVLRDRGVSAAELARRTSVPKQTISDWLAGTRPRNMDYVKKVADELGVTIVELFFGLGQEEGEKSGPPPPMRALDSFSEYSKKQEDTKVSGPSPSQDQFRGNGLLQYCSNFFFQNSDDLLQIVDLGSGYSIELSPSCSRTLGWTLDELKLRRWLEWVHPDDRSKVVASIERHLVSGEQISTVIYRSLHKSGSYTSVSSTIGIDISKSILLAVSKFLSS